METIEEKGKLVQMRLSEETLNRIDRLTVLTGIYNKAVLISCMLNLAEEFVKEVRNGNEILIKDKKDNLQKVTFLQDL